MMDHVAIQILFIEINAHYVRPPHYIFIYFYYLFIYFYTVYPPTGSATQWLGDVAS
jgi:hypothetical protein